jgi:hypothetical protein
MNFKSITLAAAISTAIVSPLAFTAAAKAQETFGYGDNQMQRREPCSSRETFLEVVVKLDEIRTE